VSEYQDNVAVPAAGTGAARSTGELSPRLRRGIAGSLAVVTLVALVAIVLEVVVLRPDYAEAQADQQARADVVRAAERFTVQVNNYGGSSIDGYESSITPMLSPKFKGEFDKAMQNIVASVKQAKMSSKGQVLTSAVGSVDPDSAQVLVVADANVKTVFDTRARHFRWEVSLVKLDGRWLVDNFTPVA
jgi:Mce-associated membrane protein